MTTMSIQDAYELHEINLLRVSLGLQPLAWHEALGQAADTHSQWLLDNDIFEHSDPVADVNAAGFDWRAGSYGFFQNHQWTEWVPGNSNAEWQYVIDAHLQAYINSPEHYANLTNPNHEIAGVSNLMGEFQGWPQAEVNTEVFGWNERQDYIFGFLYNDIDNGVKLTGQNDYDIGEGMAGIQVSIRNVSTGQTWNVTTNESGYYGVEVGAGTFEIWVGAGDQPDEIVATGAGNLMVDIANPELVRPPGSDIVGTKNADVLYSTLGDDHLTGRQGNDTFVFQEHWGHDIINDFDQRGNDVIVFQAGLFSDFADVMTHAFQEGDHVLIERGIDHVVLGNTQLSSLDVSDFNLLG